MSVSSRLFEIEAVNKMSTNQKTGLLLVLEWTNVFLGNVTFRTMWNSFTPAIRLPNITSWEAFGLRMLFRCIFDPMSYKYIISLRHKSQSYQIDRQIYYLGFNIMGLLLTFIVRKFIR